MSIASEITRLQTAKADIKTSIENKGVTVPSNASIDTYDTYIDQIQTGGGGIGIDPNPEDSTKYTYNSCSLSSYSQVTKYYKYTFSAGLELPIKWVKNVDGVELANGTYTMYNPGGQFTSAEFTISGSGTSKVLTFNYFSTADQGLPMCTVSSKRIYICIDESRAMFCTNNYGNIYLYAQTTGTITQGTDRGYQTGSSTINNINLNTTTFSGYLLNNIYQVNTSVKVVYFTVVNIA